MYRLGIIIKYVLFSVIVCLSCLFIRNKMRNDHQTYDLRPKRKVKSIDCLKLFHNEQKTIMDVRLQMKYNAQVVDSLPVNISKSFSCDDLIKKNGYITSSLTKEEEEFPIAFSILMFKHPEQFERLLRAIYRPQNFYCIHVDLKTFTQPFSSIEKISSCFSNVFMASQRINVIWGHNVLDAELVCMRDLLKYKWKYLINLTGQEFPLKANWELVKILKTYNGANDIEGTIKHANKERWKESGKPPHNLVPVKGATHIIACRGYIEFAMNNKKSLDFMQWARLSTHPEEVFFSTLNHNPSLNVPGSYLGAPETGPNKPFLARFKNWGEVKCFGKRVRRICIIGVGDLHYLLNAPQLFVNKFHDDFEPVALHCLEELIYNRTALAPVLQKTFDVGMWANLSFVKNKISLSVIRQNYHLCELVSALKSAYLSL